MNIKITPINRKEIVAALQAGKTTTELSSKYGISRSHVTVIYRKETGTMLRPVKRLSSSEKEAIIAELLANKVPVGELAARYGVTPSALSYVYKKRMGKPHRPFPSWKLSNQDRGTIVAELLAKKATIGELAKQYTVPRSTISKIFRKQAGKSFGTSHVPSQVKTSIIEEVRTNKNITKQELADKYHIHIGTLERTIKQLTGKTFRSLRPGWKSPLQGKSKAHGKLSQQDKESIVAELQAKKTTMTALAQRFHVTQSAISRVFKHMTGSAFLPLILHLSSSDVKKAIVAELLAGDATSRDVAAHYSVSPETIGRIFKRQTGKPVTIYKEMLENALNASRYRAWHTQEKKRYPVVGIDWFNRNVLIFTDGIGTWQSMDSFIIVEYSGQRDKKRTPEYPEGQEICTGDIVQFPILLQEGNGEAKETIVKDTVTFEPETCGFMVSELDDPLVLHSDECEIIGTIHENAAILSNATALAG